MRFQPQHLYLTLASFHLLQQHQQQALAGSMNPATSAKSTASGFVHENEGRVDPWALKEHLGDTYLDKIVVAAFANHRRY